MALMGYHTNVTDNQDIVIFWYNMAGIERQRWRDKIALENLGEQWIFMVKFILDLDLPLDIDSKPKVRLCMTQTDGWQLDCMAWKLSRQWSTNQKGKGWPLADLSHWWLTEMIWIPGDRKVLFDPGSVKYATAKPKKFSKMKYVWITNELT